MVLVDSHCHIDFPDYDDRRSQVIADARAQGVRYLLNISVAQAGWDRVVALAESDPHIFASIGVHPNESVDDGDPDVDVLTARASHPKVVAIGETGLDYYRGDDTAVLQQERFRRHIQAARALALPLIIHTRAASEDTLRIIDEEKAHEVGGIFHCFTESLEVAEAAIARNFHVSFSGIVTFKNAKALQKVAAALPAERILVETDAPYLAPMPHRGKTNEPAYVAHVAEKVAELRGVSVEEIAAVTTENFFRLFPKAGVQRH